MSNELTTMYKPNGIEVKVNDLSIPAAIALGWTKEKEQKTNNSDTIKQKKTKRPSGK